jgi:beta-galactosidase/beta-glucuronidase
LISQTTLGQNPKTDFEDYHYPQIPALKAMATNPNRSKVPIVLTEYNAGGGPGLANNWDVIWPTDAIVGAFLWEWQAQGMYDKFPERWNVPSPGARNDPKTGYRSSGANGPVSADRKIQPIFYTLKAVYSPVIATATDVTPAGGQCTVPLQNRYSFTDLSELTCRWQALAGEKVLATGESHVAAKPRSSVDATFPATAGMDALKLEFIHPDGRSVCTISLKVAPPK